VQDFVAADHLARVLSLVRDEIDLAVITSSYDAGSSSGSSIFHGRNVLLMPKTESDSPFSDQQNPPNTQTGS
jgi:hypothetical protein